MRALILLALLPAAALPQDQDTTLSGQVRDILAQVDKKRLKANIEKLVSFKQRNTLADWGHPTEGPGAAARWIKIQFEGAAKGSKLKALVDLHPYEHRGGKANNVFIWFKGRKHPNRVVVFGAHFDSCATKDGRDPFLPAPGANDNGSGTSAVLELARIFAGHSFDTGILFVAFSGEEQGLLGARAFARFLGDTRVEVVAMVNADIIGGSKGDDGSVDDKSIRCFSAGPESSPHRAFARYIKGIAEQYVPDFKIRIQDRIDRPGRGGDHQPFSDAGIAAARVVSTLEELRKQHNSGDVIENVDMDYLERSTRLIASVVANIAGGIEAPSGIQAKAGGLSWKPVSGAAGYVVFLRKAGMNDLDRVLRADRPQAAIEGLSAGDSVMVASVAKTGEIGLPSPEVVVE
jgi:hypothetical protein